MIQKGFNPVWFLLPAVALLETGAVTVIKMQFNSLGMSNSAAWSDYLPLFLKSPLVIFAILTLLLAPVLAFIALNRIQLSIAYPVMAALHLLFVELFSRFLLHEPVTLNKTIGMCCILLSIFLFYKDSIAPKRG